MRRGLALVVVLSLALIGRSYAAPSQCESKGNLVVNCGFEAGFTAWTTSPGESLFLDSQTPHTGLFAAGFASDETTTATLAPTSGDGQSVGAIEQIIPTVPGASYAISFFVANSASDLASGIAGAAAYSGNFINASFGGVTIFQMSNALSFPYTLNMTVLVASATSQVLHIQGFNAPGHFDVDDVSVTRVPEPSLLAVLGLGLAGVTL